MRVAIWYDLPSGGALRALIGQAQAMRTLGHQVAMWTPNSFGVDFAETWWPADMSVHVVKFDVEPSPTYLDRRFSIPLDQCNWRRATLDRHARGVTRDIERWSPDVLLVHPCWWFFASPLALHWNGPSVLYLQEPNRPLYEASPDNVWAAPPTTSGLPLRNRVGSWIRDYRRVAMNRLHVREETAWVRAFDRVLVNSLFSRESVIRAYGVDAVFCPLGADHGTFSSAPRLEKEPFVASVGQMSPHKNARLAVAAVSRISEARRPTLRWYGNRSNPGYLAQVEDDARRLGVTFEFFPEIPDEELATDLAKAACFLFCATLEPLGLSPLEANLAGTAVVAVAEGGVRETIRDGVNGTLVYNRDVDALGAAIEQYTSDLTYAATAGAAARAHVQQAHTWRHAGEVLEQQLLKAIHGKERPSILHAAPTAPADLPPEAALPGMVLSAQTSVHIPTSQSPTVSVAASNGS